MLNTENKGTNAQKTASKDNDNKETEIAISDDSDESVIIIQSSGGTCSSTTTTTYQASSTQNNAYVIPISEGTCSSTTTTAARAIDTHGSAIIIPNSEGTCSSTTTNTTRATSTQSSVVRRIIDESSSSLLAEKATPPGINPWSISLKCKQKNNLGIDGNNPIILEEEITYVPPRKPKSIVKIIYYIEEGHKARVEKSKKLINKAQALTDQVDNINQTREGRIPWEGTTWNKGDTYTNTPIGEPESMSLIPETVNSINRTEQYTNKPPTPKKIYNHREKLEAGNHLPLPQKNKKIFTKNKQCADMRIGEISHVLDYRSQQVESTFLFDNQVSVTSAGAPEHQSNKYIYL